MVYKSFIESFLSPGAFSIDWANDTIKVALADENFIFNPDNQYFSDVISYEITGTGYTQGGEELTNKTVTVTNTKATFDADDVVWSNSTVTARYGIIYKDTGNDSTSPLVAIVDKGSVFTTVNTSFSVRFSTQGILIINF